MIVHVIKDKGRAVARVTMDEDESNPVIVKGPTAKVIVTCSLIEVGSTYMMAHKEATKSIVTYGNALREHENESSKDDKSCGTKS